MAALTLQQVISQHSALLRRQQALLDSLGGAVQSLQAVIAQALAKPPSPTDEIDALEGRRIESCLVGEAGFAATDQNTRAPAIPLQVSQDGPFIATHYPLVGWFPTAPNTATNFLVWRPVNSQILPTQQVTTDFVDLKYEMADVGPGRSFQNAPRGGLLSRPDNIIPLPVPTLYPTATVLQFTPTFLRILFNGATPPTAGTLNVTIPGYRIANL